MSQGLTTYAYRPSERAQEVLNLLKGHVTLDEKTILDIGCGLEPVSEKFPRVYADLIGLDKDRRCVRIGKENASLSLVLADATSMPFKDESFDFVFCSDVLEHIREDAKLMQELLRILIRNGAAYVQCANKYQIVEPHFLLPFLSWVPRSLADIYVKVTRSGKNYAGYFPRTRRELLALTKAHRTVDLTYERTLMKIRDLRIKSRFLLAIVSFLRKILSDKSIAKVAQYFSIISILVFKN